MFEKLLLVPFALIVGRQPGGAIFFQQGVEPFLQRRRGAQDQHFFRRRQNGEGFKHIVDAVVARQRNRGITFSRVSSAASVSPWAQTPPPEAPVGAADS